MKINVHAGHCPDGKGAYGAVGLIKESTEARKVKNHLIKMLKEHGHTVYDCTCDLDKTKSTCLYYIVDKCNEHAVDLDVSIHLNAGVNDREGNGHTTGTEVLVCSSTTKANAYAKPIVDQIAKDMGYKNRGVKINSGLYVLKHTNAPALLVECCFVDDKDDATKWNPEKCAKAIFHGITGKAYAPKEVAKPVTTPAPTITPTPIKGEIYRVRKTVNDIASQKGAYTVLASAMACADKYRYNVYDSKGKMVYPILPKSYVVEINTNVLNVRKDPNGSSSIQTTVRKGQVYTIVAEKDGWGQLKSGAGWISLRYTKKM